MAGSTAAALPELAAVPWRPRVTAESLHGRGLFWTGYTLAPGLPFLAAAAVLMALDPIAAPVAFACLAHAWIIPELYAARGANVVRPKRRRFGEAEEQIAQGLLGDLLGHDARELQRETGLAIEPGELGTWLVGEAGALLLAPDRKRVHCFCVTATDADLPPSDRIAHLLLALRSDEIGFATVANHAFAGAPWRLRRRLRPEARPALATARRAV